MKTNTMAFLLAFLVMGAPFKAVAEEARSRGRSESIDLSAVKTAQKEIALTEMKKNLAASYRKNVKNVANAMKKFMMTPDGSKLVIDFNKLIQSLIDVMDVFYDYKDDEFLDETNHRRLISFITQLNTEYFRSSMNINIQRDDRLRLSKKDLENLVESSKSLPPETLWDIKIFDKKRQ